VNISGATNTAYTVTSVNNGDIFTCEVKSTAPCQDVDSSVSNAITVYVHSYPPPSVNITVYPAYYMQGDTVTFTANPAAGSTGLSFKWEKNGVAIPGAIFGTYTTHNVSAGDTICLITRSSKHCTFPDSTITCVGLTTSIYNVPFSANNIKIYPNPASTVLYTDAPGKVNVGISSIEGKLLIRKDNTAQIDLSQLANGTYLVRIYDEKGILLKIEKLVKMQ
jgi:hypothetical protein